MKTEYINRFLGIVFGIGIGSLTLGNDAAKELANASSSALSAPMKIEDGEKVLKDFKVEWEAITNTPISASQPDFKKVRYLIVSKIIQIYGRVFAAHEKNWDVKSHLPSANVGLPRDKIGPGVGFNAGMDPNNIDDPATKEAYLKAIEQNRINALHANYETGLNRLEMQTSSYLLTICKCCFRLDERDELGSIVNENASNDVVRGILRQKLGLDPRDSK